MSNFYSSLLPFYFLLFTLDFMFHKIYDSLLAVVYPQACAICEQNVEHSADGVACEFCWEKTRFFSGEETFCHKCGAFLKEGKTDFQTFCRRCDEHFYESARAAGIYGHALAASILHLKTEPFVSANLKKFFTNAFENSGFQDADLIVPVPLSKKRFLERGFNQAAVLAQILAKHTKIDLDEQSLARTIHTPVHRAAMDRKAREITVKNAFDVKRPRFVENKKILLVDDVFTTGATVSNCAKVLKKKGASNVYVFTVARAI
jgi:competence protein ComFC